MQEPESPQIGPAGKSDTDPSSPAQGFEGSAERDAKSHQVIGKHSRQVERQIGEAMPDRK